MRSMVNKSISLVEPTIKPLKTESTYINIQKVISEVKTRHWKEGGNNIKKKLMEIYEHNRSEVQQTRIEANKGNTWWNKENRQMMVKAVENLDNKKIAKNITMDRLNRKNKIRELHWTANKDGIDEIIGKSYSLMNLCQEVVDHPSYTRLLKYGRVPGRLWIRLDRGSNNSSNQ